MDKLTVDQAIANHNRLTQKEIELCNLLANAMNEKAVVVRENERLRAALAWYANEDNYDEDCRPFRDAVAEGIDCQEPDLGKTARQALAENAYKHPLADDVERCPVCHWPFARTTAEGCIPGNCSFRPHGKG